MKRLFIFSISLLGSLMTQQSYASDKLTTDTLRTYNLNEVVITSSTKETNKLQSLPSAISVISPLAIQSRQIEAIKNLSGFVPNLFIPDYGAKLTSAVYIRGIGARSSGQSIGLYIDNVPYQNKSTFDFNLNDIQRIEVLRGPQGTLYGRNAMGGIINVYTLSPFQYQGTKLSVSGGGYGEFAAKASHYNKLSKNVGISVSGYYNRNDGYFRNVYTGKRADWEEAAGGRIKLDWMIKPSLKASFQSSFDYTNQGAFAYGLLDKGTQEVESVNYNDPGSYYRRVVNNSINLEYRTDNFILSSTTGQQYFMDRMQMDQDFTDKSIFTLTQKQRQNSVSEELAIRSNNKNNYKWSFGTFGFYNYLHTDGPVTFKQDGVQGILQKVFDDLKEENPKAPYIKITDKEIFIPGTFKTPSYGVALFHQSTFEDLFTEGLSFTAGLRFDYEKAELRYDTNIEMNTLIDMGRPGMPPMPMALRDTLQGKTSMDFTQLLPKFALKYEFSPRQFVYASVTKGYKVGGYNVQMFADLIQESLKNKFNPGGTTTSIQDAVSYAPEKSWNYELGGRCDIIPDHLNADLTFFYMDIDDIQLTKFVNSGNGRIIANAGAASSYGAEVSLRSRITDALSADLNYGYTHATFKNYDDGKNNYEGNFIPYTPRHTFSVGINYARTLRCPFIDQVSFSTQYTGAGKIYWTERNDFYQKFYGTLNAKIGFRKGAVKLDVWAKNMLNTDYQAFYFESFGNSFVQKGKPFRMGADVSVSF